MSHLQASRSSASPADTATTFSRRMSSGIHRRGARILANTDLPQILSRDGPPADYQLRLYPLSPTISASQGPYLMSEPATRSYGQLAGHQATWSAPLVSVNHTRQAGYGLNPHEAAAYDEYLDNAVGRSFAPASVSGPRGLLIGLSTMTNYSAPRLRSSLMQPYFDSMIEPPIRNVRDFQGPHIFQPDNARVEVGTSGQINSIASEIEMVLCTNPDCPVSSPHPVNRKWNRYSRDLPPYILALVKGSVYDFRSGIGPALNFAQHELDYFWAIHGEAVMPPTNEEKLRALEGNGGSLSYLDVIRMARND